MFQRNIFLFYAVYVSLLMPLDINFFFFFFWEYVGVFLYASVNEFVSLRVCVCVCSHSDYRLWYSASSPTLVYAPITTAERKAGVSGAGRR